jgi:hypothetical protein
MDKIERAVAGACLVALVVGTVVGVATFAMLVTAPRTYYLLTNANDTWFEISEYRTEGWNAILVHVYAFARQAPQSPPVWEAGG